MPSLWVISHDKIINAPDFGQRLIIYFLYTCKKEVTVSVNFLFFLFFVIKLTDFHWVRCRVNQQKMVKSLRKALLSCQASGVSIF